MTGDGGSALQIRSGRFQSEGLEAQNSIEMNNKSQRMDRHELLLNILRIVRVQWSMGVESDFFVVVLSRSVNAKRM